jgi:hypothetical protein
MIGKYTHDQEGLEFLLNHIKIMCNNEERIYNYILKWNARLFQYPEIKTIAPTFTGGQGTGKTSLVELNKKLMGQSKVLETTNPSQYVFGEFNGKMADAFLVNINEAEKGDSKNNNKHMKALVKDSRLLINPKGCKHYEINSCHRFILCSNNDDCVVTSKGDRRNLVIRVSDEKQQNAEYFNQFYAYINNTNTLRTLYAYFMAMEGLESFHTEPLPITEHQELLHQTARTAPDMWLEDFTVFNKAVPSVSLSQKATYELFTNWVCDNNITYNTTPIKFGVNLSMLKIKDAIILSADKRTKVFYIDILKVHYGIE